MSEKTTIQTTDKECESDENIDNNLSALRKFMMSRSREAGNLTTKRSFLSQIGQWSQQEHAPGSPSYKLRERAVAAGVLDAGFYASLDMRELRRYEIWTNPYVAVKLADLYHICKDSSITLPPTGPLQEFLDFMERAEKRMHENQTINMLSTKVTKQSSCCSVSGSDATTLPADGMDAKGSYHQQMQEFYQRMSKLEVAVIKTEKMINRLNKKINSRKRAADKEDCSQAPNPKRQRRLQDFHLSVFKELLLSKEDEATCPVHCAVQYGHRKTIEEIVNDTNVRWLDGLDSKGRTALDFAALTGQLEVIELLRSKRANFRCPSLEGQEIMMNHARRRSHFVDSYLQYARSKQNEDNVVQGRILTRDRNRSG